MLWTASAEFHYIQAKTELTHTAVPLDLDGLTLNQRGGRRDGHLTSKHAGEEKQGDGDLGEHGDRGGLEMSEAGEQETGGQSREAERWG